MKLRKTKQPDSRSTSRQRRLSTDWQAPAAFSYHASRNEREDGSAGRQQQDAVSKRRRTLLYHYRARRSGVLFAIGAALIVLVIVSSLSTKPQIVIEDAGNKYSLHDAQTYQQAASKLLSSSIWNRNKITINTAAIDTKLRQQYPELASATVSLPFLAHKPIIYIRANDAAFVLQAVNGSYILDSDGKALLTKDSVPASESARLPLVTDQTGARVSLGKQVISSNDTAFIQAIVAELTAKQVGITALDLPAGTAEELDVHVTGQSYFIKFNMHDGAGARQQAGTYLATISTLNAQHIVPSQYVDVRVNGRAYWQ